MLAQNFKTPDELAITDKEHTALLAVLKMLEREEITPGHFDMNEVWDSCGTVGCLLGWARHAAIDKSLFPREAMATRPGPHELFMFIKCDDSHDKARPWLSNRKAVTVDQAAIALRNYLTTGEPRWAEALAGD